MLRSSKGSSSGEREKIAYRLQRRHRSRKSPTTDMTFACVRVSEGGGRGGVISRNDQTLRREGQHSLFYSYPLGYPVPKAPNSR